MPRERPRQEAAPVRESPEGLLRRLRWTVLRPIAIRLGGDERSLIRGTGMELSEVREYQPGDDVRLIDWNITARTERTYIRESLTERALDIWLLVDQSASVDWGTARCLKRDRMVEFVAAAGHLLGRHGNRIGILSFAEQPGRPIPPATGRPHLLRLLAHVYDAPRQAQNGHTDLAAALTRADGMIRQRSLIVVISDFLVPDGWQHALHRLAQRHEVVAVRLHDPREAALPDVGLITLEDPETGRQRVVDTSDRKLRARFDVAAREQAARIHGDCTRCGVDHLDLSTDDDLLPALVQFLRTRRERRRMLRVGSAARPIGAGIPATP